MPPFGQMILSLHEITPGIITMWAGSILGIPPGWALCDGTQGTPDLRNKFVISSGPLFAVGNEGGSVSHQHFFSTDNHDHILIGGTDLQSGATRPRLSNLAADDGTTDLSGSLPLFYSLAYIMHL